MQARHLGLLGLVLLGAAAIVSFRYDAYGLDEAGARALVWVWSLSEHLITPAAAYGLPDLRALLLAPLGLHWSGSLPAAKVATLFVWLGTLLLLHAWALRRFGAESAMIATGLLAVAPLALSEIDRIGGGVFLVFAFAALPVLHEKAVQAPRLASIWLVLLWLDAMLAASLHPAGWGASMAIAAWAWVRRSEPKGRAFLALALLAAALPPAMRLGWPGLETMPNPLAALGWIVRGAPLLQPAPSWQLGLVVAALFALVAWAQRRLWRSDPIALGWLLGALLGAVAASPGWALFVLAFLLLFGMPVAIALNDRVAGAGWTAKRGGVLAVCVLVATWFFLHDKAYHIAAHDQQRLVGPDRVLKLLAEEAKRAPAEEQAFVAACEWPARGLIATARAVLPLPPRNEDVESFLQQTKGLTHIAFDPRAKENEWLARMLARLSDRWITVHLLPEGVIVRYRPPKG